MCIHSNRRELNRVTNRAYVMSKFYVGQTVTLKVYKNEKRVVKKVLAEFVVLTDGSTAANDQLTKY